MDKVSWVVTILFFIVLIMGIWWYFDIGSGFSFVEERGTSSNNCESDFYNCGDFLLQKEAQDIFEKCGGLEGNNIHQLDRDGNGLACEALR